MSAVGWTMEQSACGASFGILPSVGRPMTAAATGSRIPLLAVRGGPSVALNVESRPC